MPREGSIISRKLDVLNVDRASAVGSGDTTLNG